MTGQLYATDAARIGQVNGRILKQAMFDEVLTTVGQMEEIPKNRGDTIEFKRYLPYGGVDNEWIAAGGDDEFVAGHITTEGMTPPADSITSTTITSVLQQYSCLYSYTDKTKKMHEDDLPEEEIRQSGKRIQLVRQMQVWGKLKACTNVFYGGAGTSRATVNGGVSGNMFRNIKRDLQRYHADPVTKILDPSPNFGTSSVDAAFICYAHTDLESDLYDLPDFTKVADYGSRKTISSREIGTWEGFRFILSPILTYYPGGGVVMASGPGLKADDSTNIDVYSLLVMGENAFAQVALRGEKAIESNHIPVSQVSKSDPGGQRGYIWASTWFTSDIMNQDWMAVAEVGVSSL